MLVKIEEIQGLKPLERKEPIAPKVFADALADSAGFRLVSSTPLEAKFERISHRILVTGHFEATLVCPCKRCVDDVTVVVPVEFSLRMIPESEFRVEPEPDAEVAGPPRRRSKKQKAEDDEQAATAGSFEIDQVDAEPFNGKTIDLDPVVREQVLLALPVSVLCREDCKGLCTVCGQELNEKDCGHSGQKPVDARLAKLKDIKLKQ